MQFTTPELSYKAYGYKNSNSPVVQFTKQLKLVPSPSTSEGGTPTYVIPDDKILIKIHYAALNPVDIKLRQVAFPLLAYFSRAGPYIGIGRDFSGEVVSVGSKITNVKVGEFIQGFYPGTFADGTVGEYFSVSPSELVFHPIPSNITPLQAAAWPLVFGTAITLASGLELEGKKILVLGGGTTVGRFLTQILHIEKAKEVVVTCSQSSREILTKYGATSIIDYKAHKNIANPVLESVKETGEFDHIIDCWGGNELFKHMNTIIKRGGYYKTIVGDYSGSSGGVLMCATFMGFYRMTMSKLNLSRYKYWLGLLPNDPTWMEKGCKYIEDGGIDIPIDHIYNFDEFDKALEKLEEHSAKGKLVVKVIGD
ncbi:YIM1 [[Candida] subhashii]|uniref:YIM1 n=1 Tax=[Candida] subhashii TaxID=561895 RepID=A0A8J5QDH1_9ASCO|nr:YIM1 [[Candida] subhashii]KAG7662901.1 YIM1 [[Candida] subhashii]